MRLPISTKDRRFDLLSRRPTSDCVCRNREEREVSIIGSITQQQSDLPMGRQGSRERIFHIYTKRCEQQVERLAMQTTTNHGHDPSRDGCLSLNLLTVSCCGVVFRF